MNPVRLRTKLQEIRSYGYVPTLWEKRFLKTMRALARAGIFTRGKQDIFVEEIFKKASLSRQRLPVVEDLPPPDDVMTMDDFENYIQAKYEAGAPQEEIDVLEEEYAKRVVEV